MKSDKSSRWWEEYLPREKPKKVKTVARGDWDLKITVVKDGKEGNSYFYSQGAGQALRALFPDLVTEGVSTPSMFAKMFLPSGKAHCHLLLHQVFMRTGGEKDNLKRLLDSVREAREKGKASKNLSLD